MNPFAQAMAEIAFPELPALPPKDFISAAIEIALLAWLWYVVLRFLHGTRGLAVMKGVAFVLVLVVLVLSAVGFLLDVSFPRLAVAGRVLFPIIGIMLVVLFQPELRTGFTRLSERGGKLRGEAPVRLADFTAAILSLSRRHTGALVVFEQQTGLGTIEATGVPLDSSLSGALVEAIFYPKSPLHDGAVIVRDGRIVAASCMLPLTDSTSVARDLGTRHRAALGITEETDAVAVVVSEETGRVSVAHRGFLHPVEGSDSLLASLTDFLQGYGMELATA